MSRTIVIESSRVAAEAETGRSRPHRYRIVIFRAFALTLALALATAVVWSAVDFVRGVVADSAARAAAEPVEARPRPELPPEWRKWGRDTDVEHMYNRPPPPKGVDWIRGNGR